MIWKRFGVVLWRHVPPGTIERAIIILLVIVVVIAVLVLSRTETLNVYCNISGSPGE